MTTDTITFVRELVGLATDLVDPKGKTMDHWDEIRRQVETRKGSDLPRLNFESLMEGIAEKIQSAAELLDITETGYQQICRKNDEMQNIIGMMTAALNANNAECSRMRLALMKISGRAEYDPQDGRRASQYKRDEGLWTTDEYLADAALCGPLKSAQGKS